MNNDILNKFETFYSKYNLLKGPQLVNFYFDEPRFYYFHTEIDTKADYFSKFRYFVSQGIYGSGSSYFDKEIALIKCLGEATERICQQTFDPKAIQYHRYCDLNTFAINPSIHYPDDSIEKERLGWVIAHNLTNDQDYLIPAQYAHYTYLTYHSEPRLTTLISTGGALGTTHEGTLLSGLYELIERDAFITTYLLRAPVKKIELGSIPNDQIQYIYQQLKRYNLEWHLFDITHDLEIPVFLTIITDNTGIGPAITSGASSRFNIHQAIINSVSEASMTRPWLRSVLSHKEVLFAILNSDKKRITQRLERGLYWYLPERITKMDFWLDKKTVPLQIQTKTFQSEIAELNYLVDNMRKHKYDIYYADLTHKQIKKCGFYVYKVINPYLHGLYLDETETRCTIDPKRLRKIANFFGIKKYTINPILHPFL